MTPGLGVEEIASELTRYLVGRERDVAPGFARLLRVTLARELEELAAVCVSPAAAEDIARSLAGGMLSELEGLSPAELARNCRRAWDCDLDSDGAKVMLAELCGFPTTASGPVPSSRSRWPSVDRFGAAVAEMLEPERLRRVARAAMGSWRGTAELARFLGDEWHAAVAQLPGPIGARLDPGSIVARAEHLEVARDLAQRLGRPDSRSAAEPHRLGTLPPSRLALGSELRGVIPAELALLARATTRPLFLERLASEKLAVVERRTRTVRHTRGPLIVLLDVSGSMAGEPELDAKAIVLALARELRAEGRLLRVIQFSGASDQQTRDVQPNPLGLANLVELLGQSFHGATDFDAALLSALTSLDTPSCRQADVVMVTDGKGRFSRASADAVERVRRERGVRFELVRVASACSGATGSFAARSDFDNERRCDDVSRRSPSGWPCAEGVVIP
ncbi:MAG: VWA domain-containing protein [Myxococcales bacterium]|nr:VWA domain-containing protein [Myxococcales bacterium]